MKIPLYCDYACPWAYLASCRVVFVAEVMFWGNDRFELVRHFIEKQP